MNTSNEIHSIPCLSTPVATQHTVRRMIEMKLKGLVASAYPPIGKCLSVKVVVSPGARHLFTTMAPAALCNNIRKHVSVNEGQSALRVRTCRHLYWSSTAAARLVASRGILGTQTKTGKKHTYIILLATCPLKIPYHLHNPNLKPKL